MKSNFDACMDVIMSYSVIVTDLRTGQVACDATGGPFWYQPGRSLPPPEEMHLGWWAPSDARCSALPPGDYLMETCWTAKVSALLPPKSVCRKSNPFTVRE